MDISESTYNRKDTRRDIVLEARVFFDGNGIMSRINNLSLGGTCVTLPFPCAHYRPMIISAVEIEGIGHFSATTRWASDFRVGLQFNDYAGASRVIRTFFSMLDDGTIEPVQPRFRAF